MSELSRATLPLRGPEPWTPAKPAPQSLHTPRGGRQWPDGVTLRQNVHVRRRVVLERESVIERIHGRAKGPLMTVRRAAKARPRQGTFQAGTLTGKPT